MAWLEITIETEPKKIGATATALTAQGFSELVIEDQQEFETFLDENRAYWDYIDENLQQQLQGLLRAQDLGDLHLVVRIQNIEPAQILGVQQGLKTVFDLPLPQIHLHQIFDVT